MENKYWEYNCKPFKEGNWKTFVNVVNASFPNDVRWNWKQVQDKWNKMKKICEIKKEEDSSNWCNSISWPWFDHFDNVFSSTAKINGIPNAIDQGMHVMNSETKVVNVNDEEDVQTLRMLEALRDKLMCLRMTMQMLELTYLLILIALELGHASYLLCKRNLIRS